MTIAIAMLSTACKDGPQENPQTTSPTRVPIGLERPDAELLGVPARRAALADVPGTAKIDQEIYQYQRAIKALPKKVDLWILLGHAWVRKARESADPGFYLNADACATAALEIEPASSLALDLRGLVLLNSHKFREAYDLAARIVSEHPDDPMGYGTLSDALLELGRFDEAATAVQKMADLKPNLPSYSRAAHMRWLRGDSDAALDIVRKAIDAGDSRDPEPQAWVIVQSGMMFWHRGDYRGADAGFDLALSRMDAYPPAMVGKGRVALALRNAKRAVEWFERAYTQNPLVETAWLLGDAREAMGDADGAAKAFALVERNGRASDPRMLSLYLSTKSKKAAEALALAQAEKNVRGDIYTDDVEAWALYRNGRIAEAKDASDRAVSLGTRDARLLYHAGQIRIASGDPKAGRKLVADAVQLNPQFDATESVEAQRLLGAAGR